MDILAWPPTWLLLVALFASLYQGSRGWYLQALFAESQRHSEMQSGEHAKPVTPRPLPSKAAMHAFRSFADAWLYAVASLAGFTALFFAYRLLTVLPEIGGIEVGAATLFVFFALFGVVGVTGQLPHLIQQGKFPK